MKCFTETLYQKALITITCNYKKKKKEVKEVLITSDFLEKVIASV